MPVTLTEVQRVPTSGARALEPVQVAGHDLLAIAQLARDVPGTPPGMNGGDSDTRLLLLNRAGGCLAPWATLPAPGGEDAEFFTIGNRAFLAVASIRTGAGPYDYAATSTIFEWRGGEFTAFQQFPTFAAKQWKHDLFARAQQPTAEIIAYIRRMAARATPRGWHLQFYTPGTVVRDLLPFLADFEDTFVIDHLGYLTEPDPSFERRLLAVLAQGSCWIKLSGAYRVAKDKPLSAVAPWASALVAARPDRLIWGSDWPHLPNGQRDTGEILNLLADWAPTEQARQAVLVDGPGRLFFD